MNTIKRTILELDPNGSLFQLRLDDNTDEYILTGGAGNNLVAGISVTLHPDDTASLVEGVRFVLKYEGNLVYTGGNVVTIFGTELTAVQATTQLLITATYNGSDFEVDIETDLSIEGAITVDKISDTAFASTGDMTTGTEDHKVVSPLNVKNWWDAIKAATVSLGGALNVAGAFTPAGKVTLSGAASASKAVYLNSSKDVKQFDLLQVITKEVSFESGEQSDNGIYIPYDFEVTLIKAVVTKTIAGTDNATITAKIDSTAITSGVVTITLSSALDSVFTATPSALNTGASGSYIKLTAAKSTAGGRVCVSITVKRIFD